MELCFDKSAQKTPYYVVSEPLLRANLRILRAVADAAGCKILLAQKAFSMFSLYPLVSEYLDGTAASGLFEARLGREEFGGEVHTFSAAYNPDEFAEILKISDHVIFNSMGEWERYKNEAVKSGKKLGIRINPELSTQEHAIYDPCSFGSRLGVALVNFPEELPDGISGLHFHTLCEQNSDALIATLAAVEAKFGKHFGKLEWINFGGGHHITRADYGRDALSECIRDFKSRYGLEVYLEPGEAVALNAGFLVSTVLDIIENGVKNAILDTSAACHMPDVIEMPYRPNIVGAGEAGEKAHNYRLGGPTCLAGDIIGDYSFDSPLNVGDRLVFCDMAIYSMVKNNTFNGMRLPSIAIADDGGAVRLVREFGYEDFKTRIS